MQVATSIIEIFSSLQGEGTHAGERQLFVRFQGCSLSCQFCDTPASFIENPRCRVEKKAFTKQFEYYENPLSLIQLNEIIDDFDDVATLTITGGEPLESSDFLLAWLPTLAGRYRILLETAGIHGPQLRAVLSYVDIVSMDLKLPSVTGMRAYWDEHRDFLNGTMDKERYVKVVVSADTDPDELKEAARLVAAEDRQIPFILQAATPFAEFRAAPSPQQLEEWRCLTEAYLSDVRVIPQLHKLLKIL